MRKLVVVAALGIAVLFAIAAAVILGTDPRRLSVEQAPPETGPEREAPSPAASASPLPPAPAIPSSPAGPAAWAEARTLQLPDGVVATEIAPPLGPCFAEAGEPSPAPSLRLLLEAVPGGLLIVEVEPAASDEGSERLVACARGVLRGRNVSLSGFRPGDRYEARYLLAASSPGAPLAPGGSSPDAAPQRPYRRPRARTAEGTSP